MKLKFFVVLMVFLAVAAQPARPQQAQKPLTKDQVIGLAKAGMETPELVKLIHEHGIDFDLTDDYLQALRQAGAQEPVIQALHAARPKPLTKEQVLQLLAGHVPSERAAALVRQHGIDFLPDEQYFEMLRLASADDALIAALRSAGKAVTAELVVTTSPNAEVYLDGQLVGRANAQGELTIKSKLGTHALKVSLKGKKDFEQSITLASAEARKFEARLIDLPGSIRVQTLAGARVTLDDVSRGSTDASGQLTVDDVAPGAHELGVSAEGKKDFRQNITVVAGQESRIDAPLAEIEKPALAEMRVRENPKDGLKYVWIPPGTFLMGCSPGDSECYADEKPAHQVTITRGFWMGQTAVTVGAYKRFAAATGRQMPGAPDFNSGWANDAMPIVNVSWDDATAFCGWAGGRLPTGAEWECAARGGSTEGRYGPIDEIAWYENNSGKRAHEVAQKRANGFGLFDMLGNVLQWVNDWYDEKYYQSSPSQDPAGPASGQFRVLRGGFWLYSPRNVRVSFRSRYNPALRYDGIGFRCGGEVFAP
jgi:formylglycine-generating enzyme required for sulfatase activity